MDLTNFRYNLLITSPNKYFADLCRYLEIDNKSACERSSLLLLLLFEQL